MGSGSKVSIKTQIGKARVISARKGQKLRVMDVYIVWQLVKKILTEYSLWCWRRGINAATEQETEVSSEVSAAAVTASRVPQDGSGEPAAQWWCRVQGDLGQMQARGDLTAPHPEACSL